MTGVPTTHDAVVRAEKGTDSDQHSNLDWTIGTTYMLPVKDGGKPVAPPTPPPIQITRPRLGGKVGFLFLVHGT
jgi:hypothetical protein